MQLSIDDKENVAIKIWLETPPNDRADKELRLQQILSVGPKQIQRFLSRTKKETKEQARKRAFDLWLSLHTQEEIAEAVGWERRTIADWIEEFGDFGHMSESAKTLTNHADEKFACPVYNIWKQQTKTEGSKHFGNSEVRWLDNLLYLYTKPFDVIVDPFAGGGSTIDLCKRRYRRYWVSDRKPVVERETEIRRHDSRARAHAGQPLIA